MVDNRSAGVFGIGGSFNFKSGDTSGTAAKMTDEKMGQGGEYAFLQKGQKENNAFREPFVDRSAQLSATLASLAMVNVANILKNIKKSKRLQEMLDAETTEDDDNTVTDNAVKKLEETFEDID